MKVLLTSAALFFSLTMACFGQEKIPGGTIESKRRVESIEVKSLEQFIKNPNTCEVEGRADVIRPGETIETIKPEAGNVFVVITVKLKKIGDKVPTISQYDYVLATKDDTGKSYKCKGISAKGSPFDLRPCPPVAGDDVEVRLLFEVPEKVNEFVMILDPEIEKELPMDEININFTIEE